MKPPIQTHENSVESESNPPITLGSATSSIHRANKRKNVLTVLGCVTIATLIIVPRFRASFFSWVIIGILLLVIIVRPGPITAKDDVPMKEYLKSIAVEFGGTLVGMIGILLGLFMMLWFPELGIIIVAIVVGTSVIIRIIIRLINNHKAKKTPISMRKYPPLQ